MANDMETAVFGATGRTGRHVVREALAADHEVRAFVRDREKLADDRREDDRVTVVEGDVIDAEAVEWAIEGADAVVSALGHADGSPDNVLTIAAENITAAMEAHDVPRVVTLVGAGVSHPNDSPSLGGRVMSGALKLVAGDLLDDSNEHVRRVIGSDVEWVVVRPPRLTDGPGTGDYRTGYLRLGPRATISRADLAAFMIAQASTDTDADADTYIGEAPMIAY
jgi:putative NADH-flavin reductase